MKLKIKNFAKKIAGIRKKIIGNESTFINVCIRVGKF